VRGHALDVRAAGRAQGAQLDVSVDAGVPPTLDTDRQRLEQILRTCWPTP